MITLELLATNNNTRVWEEGEGGEGEERKMVNERREKEKEEKQRRRRRRSFVCLFLFPPSLFSHSPSSVLSLTYDFWLLTDWQLCFWTGICFSLKIRLINLRSIVEISDQSSVVLDHNIDRWHLMHFIIDALHRTSSMSHSNICIWYLCCIRIWYLCSRCREGERGEWG